MLVILEAVVRLLPGVVGNPESLTEESHAAEHDGLLEGPVYTKPTSWRGLDVPPVLLSGNHGGDRRLAPRPGPGTHPPRPSGPRPGRAGGRRRTSWSAAATPADAGELLTLQRAAYLAEGRINGSMEHPAADPDPRRAGGVAPHHRARSSSPAAGSRIVGTRARHPARRRHLVGQPAHGGARPAAPRPGLARCCARSSRPAPPAPPPAC